MNIYAMFADAFRRFPNKTALSFGDRHLSYREVDAVASALAAHYKSLGCLRGDRIVLFLRNSLDYPILLLAAFRGGFIVVPVNAKLHPGEVAWICENAGARLIVAQREHLASIRGSLANANLCQLVAAEDLEIAKQSDASDPVTDVLPEDPAWIFYTSGTTGRPKGAVLTHRNLIAQVVNCLADVFDFKFSDHVLHVAPLSHASGMYLIPAMVRGAQNIISDLPRFDPDEVLDLVVSHNVSVLAFVAPTMIVRMLAARARPLNSLRGIIYGGSTIHLEHIRAAVQRFGPIFHQLYGQGEAPMTISYLSGSDHLNASDETLLSAGYVRSGVEVQILDDSDAIVPQGHEGEICVRGDVVMSGYWRDEQASAAALRGGWLRTGDMGRFDGGGRLRVLDRRHDTIISGGTNIYPKEVEDVIAAHPHVRETIAFGVRDPEWGERVVAAVVVKDGRRMNETEIIAFCNARLGKFKQPTQVIFLDELPKSAYGKILRRELRARYEKSP